MNIPRFWVSATEEVRNPRGQRFRLSSWGWSSESRQEAQARAREYLSRLVSRVRHGQEFPPGYGYGGRPLREEILEEVGGPSPSGVVTRNSYGCLVLNTSRAMFIDIDVAPPTAGQRLRRWLRPGPAPDDGTLARLRERLGAAGSSFRVYRTAGGFRVLATGALFTPGAPEAERLMESVGADPAFVRLCRAQQSFRARLTPKPWRCGERVPPSRFPRDDAAARDAFAAWLARYDAAAARWATCAMVEDIGSAWAHREIAPLLELHDRVTRATSGLPLA